MRVSREQANANRKRVLDVAGSMFREKGFDGVGVAELMRAAGLTHGGFYGQFGSKEELAAEALRGVLDQAVQRWTSRAAAAPEDPFAAIVSYYLSSKHCDAVALGCPISALSGEMPRQSDAMRTAYTDGLAKLCDVLAENVAGDQQGERRTEALAVMASITGAVILARAVNDPALSLELLAATRVSLGLPKEAHPS